MKKRMSQVFGNNLSHEFKRKVAGKKLQEISHFRALSDSFRVLGSNFKVDEYHGAKHQVRFRGKGSWGRKDAKCEISDLLIVSYSFKTVKEIRMTFLQAKKSDKKNHDFSSKNSDTFQANLEQWDLLSRRPNVTGYRGFKCHPEILSGAMLSSVGSIGVFHELSCGDRDFFYISASNCRPLNTPTQKMASLKVLNSSVNTVKLKGLFECIFAKNMETFGEYLYDLKIGTPIHSSESDTEEQQDYKNKTRGWLRQQILAHCQKEEMPLTTKTLFDNLESDFDDFQLSRATNLVIINTDLRPEELEWSELVPS